MHPLHIITQRSGVGIVANEAKVDDSKTAIASGLGKNCKVLLVSDIARGGNTLKAAYEHLTKQIPEQNIATATLFCHRDASTRPKFYVAMTEKVVRFDWKEWQVVCP